MSNFLKPKYVVVNFFQNNPENIGMTGYWYYVREGDDPKEGDIIVTNTNLNAEGNDFPIVGWGVACVRSVHTEINSKDMGANKTYVSLIKRKDYEKAKEENAKIVALEKEKKKAKKTLDAMIANMEDAMRYKMLLDVYPEAKDLIEILKK